MDAAEPPSLHPDLAPLAFLIGRWRGTGQGTYPTIAPFSYEEEITFAHSGKPFLSYVQRTWAPSDGRLLHAESGYWRSRQDGHVELVLAQPTGIAEIAEGGALGQRVEVVSTTIGRSSTAKAVTSTTRRIEVSGDNLTYLLDLEAVGQPGQEHLRATLIRVT